MDVFSTAAEMPGEMALSSDQLAQLRAINTSFYLRVHALLRGPDGRTEDRDLTEEETASLRAMLVTDILSMLTPEQRSTLQHRPS